MNKKVIFRGASAIMPLCIGDFPFSFIVGALSVSAGMSVWQSTAWSAIVIAGSAQMLALNIVKNRRHARRDYFHHINYQSSPRAV